MKRSLLVVLLALLIHAGAHAGISAVYKTGKSDSLNAYLTLDPSEVGVEQQVFIMAVSPAGIGMLDESKGWVEYRADIPLAVARKISSSGEVSILPVYDQTKYANTDIYVGYGISAAEMLRMKNFSRIWHIGEPLQTSFTLNPNLKILPNQPVELSATQLSILASSVADLDLKVGDLVAYGQTPWKIDSFALDSGNLLLAACRT